MSKESLEHLSSLMDGELSREAGLFITRRLSADDEMCQTWERYHLIRDCIRQPGGKHLVTGLAFKMNASLEAETAPVSRAGKARSWLKPVSGLAIAASVAMMAIVVTAPPTADVSGEGADSLVSPAAEPFVSPNTLPMAPVSQAASYDPAGQANSNALNAYLLRHNQMARTAGRQGFVSFVPIVATPATPVTEASAEEADSAGTDSQLQTIEE